MLKNTSRFKKLCKSAAAVLIGLQLAITSLVPVMAEDISLSDTSKASTYKIADLDVAVTVSDDLVCFTQNVTSNNSYLDLIGADDVEQLRALMKVNNIYLEIIPKQNVTYEILLSGKDAPSGVESLNDLSDDELQSSFKSYESNLIPVSFSNFAVKSSKNKSEILPHFLHMRWSCLISLS